MKHGMKTACALLLLLVLLLNSAAASVQVETITRTAGESSIAYPEITGMANAFAQDQINEAIKNAITPHLNTFAVLEAGTAGQLKMESETVVFPSADGHDLLSILVTAEGRMPNGRTGYQQLPLQFDLANGQQVQAEQLFLSPEDALARMEALVEAKFEEDLSNYLDLTALKPFPLERLMVDEAGIRFFYPEDSLTWLSGRPASMRFLFHEMLDLLNLEEGSFLHSLGISKLLEPGEEAGNSISEAVKAGKLPGLDVRLGDRLEEAVIRHKLLHDPERFADGEKYQLEDDRFRGTVLISYNDETVDGLLSKRMNLAGLIAGLTTQDTARQTLGEPVVSLALGEDAAQQYGLPVGTMDIYPHENTELRLAYDEDKVLVAIWIQRSK